MDPFYKAMIEQLKEANKILQYEVQETEQKVEEEANKILRITGQKVELREEANKILRDTLRETEQKCNALLHLLYIMR